MLRRPTTPVDRLCMYGRIDPDLDEGTKQYLATFYERALDVSDHLRTLSADPARVALLVVDVQKVFASQSYFGNPRTEKISGQIAKLAPRFRQAGVGIYGIHLTPESMFYRKAADRHKMDFYRFSPDRNHDHIISKRESDAFTSGKLKNTLKKEGHSHVLVCGFNLSACVAATMRGAFKHCASVTLLKDLSCDSGDKVTDKDHEETLRRSFVTLQEQGGYACDSAQFLSAVSRTALNA